MIRRAWRRLLLKLLGYTEPSAPGLTTQYIGRTDEEKWMFWQKQRDWVKIPLTQAFFILAEKNYQALQGEMLKLLPGPNFHDALVHLKGQMVQQEWLMQYPAFVEAKVTYALRVMQENQNNPA